MNSYDDEKLVRQAQAGDIAAFETLVKLHQQFAFQVALSALSSPQEAEDATQEAFVKVWQALPNFRQEARFRTWLYRIVMNLCYNRIPRLRQDFYTLEEEFFQGNLIDQDQQSAPDTYLEEKQLFDFLHRQIDCLPEKYRIMLLLRFREGCSYAEIAEILDIPLGTVKTGIFRAREQLRAAVADYHKERVWT